MTCKECKRTKRLVAHSLCKSCYDKAWRADNPELVKRYRDKSADKNGGKRYHINKECTAFLGVHIGERLAARILGVEPTTYHDGGVDFILDDGSSVQVKASMVKDNRDVWEFQLNSDADKYLLMAFVEKSLTGLWKAWLIPTNILTSRHTSVTRNTCNKWSKYEVA